MATLVNPQSTGQLVAGPELSTSRVVAIAAVAALGGFLFGFDTAVINGTVGALQAQFTAGSWALGLTVSSALLGSAAGAFWAGRLADRYGRTRTMMVASLFFTVSALGSGFAVSLWDLSLWRTLGGVAVGAASVVAPAYIAEIAPAHLRGRLGALQQLAIVIGIFMALLANYAIATTAGIVLALIFNTVRFFQVYPASEFFFGTTWSPSFGGGSELGILPLVWGTLYISIIALLVAVPLGLLSAVYLSEYASRRVRSWAKPMLEVLAGIPSIVYGLFALLTVGPALLRVFGSGGLGWMQGGTAVITAGLVMGVMLIPFVSSLSDDIINAVPQTLRDGSYGLGATRSETIRQVVLPAALPGIMGAVLLAASRAIGETMIVVMAAGLAANLTANPFASVTTVTTQIVQLLTGDQEFDSAKTLAAFALGLVLFIVTLLLNIVALRVVKRYREAYE